MGSTTAAVFDDETLDTAGLGGQYRALFEEAPVAYHEIALDGTVARVNRMECELLGFTREEMVGRPVWDFVPPAIREVSRTAVHKKLNGTDPLIPFEREYARSDGKTLTFQVHENRIYDAEWQVSGIRTAMLDITERKRQDAALAERTAELARSNEELEQFAYVASHDLQEPLRMVASYTQLLARRYTGKLGPDADEFIAFAVDGAVRMQHLINDLLAYSRVGTRGGKFCLSSAEAALDAALSNLRGAIQESGVAVHRDPLPVIWADRMQIVQVFQNLLGNALKFHGEASPIVSVSCKELADFWQFSVADNGIGIDPKHAGRIFLVFQRLHTRTEYPGTGIGLAICRKVVERHGGQIWVESAPAAGATFYFTLRKNPGGQ